VITVITPVIVESGDLSPKIELSAGHLLAGCSGINSSLYPVLNGPAKSSKVSCHNSFKISQGA